MKFRNKLLLAFTFIALVTVMAVALIVSWRTRHAFERADSERTEASIAQFKNSFEHSGAEVAAAISEIAHSETAVRMAAEVASGADPALFLDQAKTFADAHHLDFLDVLGPDGAIISSAEWTARFGYKEPLAPLLAARKHTFLRSQEMPNGSELGIFAVRTISYGPRPLYLLGGRRLDQTFLDQLTLPPGMRAIIQIGPEKASTPLSPLIMRVLRTANAADGMVHWGRLEQDAEFFHASPLLGVNREVLGVILIGSSRRAAIELQQAIRAISLAVAGGGVLLAILLSGYLATRITKPIQRLAAGVGEVARGDWNVRVAVSSRDEIGVLATAFNGMTQQLADQRERLLQTERVAAWRELARRLAHELKNPLFPLQITIENMVRARQCPPAEFDEVFRESTAALLAELANMKAIIGRFSDFSRMPKPQLQPVSLNTIAEAVVQLMRPQLNAAGRPAVRVQLDLDPNLSEVEVDPDLLHRALTNLVLNALDAMPDGGELTLRTHREGEQAVLEISDTGSGLTPEECERLFTPYYTTKQHGTGLGLAIVQSVISDHSGKITVASHPGKGTTFKIELPLRHVEMAQAAQESDGE